MEALHFGDAARPLFGLRFEPTGAARRTAVLLCPSLGMEYMRSYRGLSLLGQKLAEHGFDTLRFDYACTGDSAGQTGGARLEDWIGDVRRAAEEIRATSDCPHLCVIGLRLGALIARAAVAGGLKVEHLATWDAPASGAAWVAEMRALETPYYERKNLYRPARFTLRPSSGELLGMPVDDALLAGLDALAPPLPAAGSATRVHLFRSAGQPAAAASGEAASEEAVPLEDEGNWQDIAWLTTPWTPAHSIQRIARTLVERLP